MLAAAERAAEIAGTIGHDRFLAWAEERRGSALSFLGRSEESGPALEKALPLLERVGGLGRMRIVLSNLGESRRLTGQMEEAKRYNERSLGVCERVGDPYFIAFSLMNLSQILLTLGHWDESREYLERASEVLSTLTSASAFAAYIPSMLGQVLLRRGDWEEAEVQLERALDIAQRTEDRQVLELIHVALAELGILQGESEAPIAQLEPMAGGAGGSLVLIETALAWARLDHGDVERAEEIASQAVRTAREQGEILALVDALRVHGMALTTQGQTVEAEGIFSEGLALAQSLPYPHAEGQILDLVGRRDEALAIFRRLGAQKDIERLERAPASL